MAGRPRDSGSALAAELLDRLAAHADPTRAEFERRYLKSERDFLGVTVPTTRKVVRELLRDHPELEHDGLLDAALASWDGPFFDCRRAATELLALRSSLLAGRDLLVLEPLIRDAETWALVDPLAGSVTGTIVARGVDDEVSGVLDRWSVDPDSYWVRRASMLALLLSLRTSLDEWPRFCRYAESMLSEKEFFIRKAIGWVLRDTSRRWPDEVREWVEPRLDRMSGVTRREALKYL